VLHESKIGNISLKYSFISFFIKNLTSVWIHQHGAGGEFQSELLLQKKHIMKKNLIYVLILIVNLGTITSTAQSKQNTSDLLEITGAALLNDQRVSNYSVSVYLDGLKIDSMFTRSKKTIKFYVSYNRVYTFLYQKENCMDKIIIVNTQVPEGLKTITDNTFDFDVEMSQSLTRKSPELEDYPVAVLLIDKEEEVLQASPEYNKLTHNEPEIITLNESADNSIGKSGIN
jgi:hypothetical protein